MAIVNQQTGEVEYEGKVLELFARSCTMDSYDTVRYAIVWDGAAPKTLRYAHTRDTNSKVATVDAADEVITAYKYWANIREVERKRDEDWEEEIVIRKGKMVKVVRGRKIPKGTLGRVEWTGVTKNGYEMTLLTGNIWVYTRNIEVLANPTKAERIFFG